MQTFRDTSRLCTHLDFDELFIGLIDMCVYVYIGSIQKA